MGGNALSFIDCVVAEARDGAVQDKRAILRLLALEPRSEEAAYLAEQARLFALEVSGGRARVAGAIGLDRAPCKMNCAFCSFGEKWGLVKEESVLSLEQVVSIARSYVQGGVTMVTLRTTEFYDLNAVMALARMIRAEVPGSYELNMNVGELTPELCEACHDAGIFSAYHVLRLREGIDAPFDPEERKRTIRAIVDSPLRWNTNIEPVGREHTDEELADHMAFALSLRPYSIGIMPRVPVKGTPFGETHPLDAAPHRWKRSEVCSVAPERRRRPYLRRQQFHRRARRYPARCWSRGRGMAREDAVLRDRSAPFRGLLSCLMERIPGTGSIIAPTLSASESERAQGGRASRARVNRSFKWNGKARGGVDYNANLL